MYCMYNFTFIKSLAGNIAGNDEGFIFIQKITSCVTKK